MDFGGIVFPPVLRLSADNYAGANGLVQKRGFALDIDDVIVDIRRLVRLYIPRRFFYAQRPAKFISSFICRHLFPSRDVAVMERRIHHRQALS